jgi:hypothetical protein
MVFVIELHNLRSQIIKLEIVGYFRHQGMISKYTTKINESEIKVDDMKTAAEVIMTKDKIREPAPLFELNPSTAFCRK